MVAAFKTALGSNFNNTSGTTLVITNNNAISVGDLVVVRWASDNLSATTPTVTVTDYGGNTWTVLRQAAVNATAAAGCAGGMLASKITSGYGSGGTITLTFSGAVTGKAAYAESFSGAEIATRVAAVGATGTATAASAGATAAGVLAGDLVLGHFANETRAALTADSDTTNGNWSNATTVVGGGTSGQDATSVTCSGQYKIPNASGAQTFNYTAVASEWVIGCVVLQATPPPVVSQAAYRFFAEGSESASVALGTQSTAYSADVALGDVNLQLRVRLQETGTAVVPSSDFELQYSKNGGAFGDVLSNPAILTTYPFSEWSSWLQVQIASGQSFTGNGEKLARMAFDIGKSGAPPGTYSAALYAHSGTFGTSSVGTGAPLATSTTTLDASGISATFGWVFFDFGGTFTLANGTNYVMAITTNNIGDASNRVNMVYDSASPTRPGNRCDYNGSTWTAASGYDYMTRVYTVPATLPTNVAGYNSTANYDLLATQVIEGTNLSAARLTGGTGSFSTAGTVATCGLCEGITWSTGNFTELLFAITLKSADLANSDALTFRVVKNNTTTDMTYTVTPTINVVKVPVAVTQAAYRFYADGTESGSTASATQSTALTWNFDTGDAMLHLRTRLQSTTAMDVPATDDWRLQYAKDGGAWTDVNTLNTAGIYGFNSSSLTEGQATTNRLTGGTGTFVAGKVAEDGLADDVGWTANNYTELLHTFYLDRTYFIGGEVLTFRVVRNGATTGMTYSATPTLNITKTAPTLTQGVYRFYDDAGTESGAAPLAAENTAVVGNLTNGDGYGALRIRLQNTASVQFPSTGILTLQWEKNASGTWTNVGTGAVLGYDNPNLTDNTVTTSRLTAGTGTFDVGSVSEDGNITGFPIAAGRYTEHLFSLKLVAAQFAAGDVLRFRVVQNLSIASFMTYTVTPTVNIVRIFNYKELADTPYLKPTIAVATTATVGVPPTTGLVYVMKIRGPQATFNPWAIASQNRGDPNNSWRLTRFAQEGSSGNFFLAFYPSGTYASGVAVGSSGTNHSVDRVNPQLLAFAYTATSGAWKVLGSTNGGVTWPQLDSGSGSAMAAAFNSNDIVMIGDEGSGGGPWDDRIYSIELRTGLDPLAGAVLWRFDAGDYPGSGTSYVDPRGRTWTLGSAAAIIPATMTVNVTATVTCTDTYTPASTNYNETGRSITIAATTTPTDKVGFKELALSIPVAAATTITTALKDRELALSVPVVATTTTTQRSGNKELARSLAIAATTATVTESAHYKETGGGTGARTFLNHVTVLGPRNTTATHTVSPSSGTVLAGSAFTPTVGRYLLVIVEGGVTSYGASPGTVPTGWDFLVEVIGNTGMYAWSRTVTGSDSLTVNHNGSNYPIVCDFYEFPAGTTFTGIKNQGSIAKTAANPSISGLTGTTFVMAAKDIGIGTVNTTATSWSSPNVETLDVYADPNITDGFYLSVCYQENYVGTSYAPTGTITTVESTTCEAITLALSVPVSAAPAASPYLFTEDWNVPDDDHWDWLKWPIQRPVGTVVSNRGSQGLSGPGQQYADQYVTDFEATWKWQWDSTMSGQYPEFGWRMYSGMGGNSTASGYVIQVDGSPGSVWIYKVGGYATVGTGVSSSSLNTAGTRWFKVRVVGSSFKVKWWDVGNSEPGTWQIDAIDSSPQTDVAGVPVVGGAVGFRMYGATPVLVDDFTITDLASPPTPTPDGSLRVLSNAKIITCAGDANVFEIDTDLTWCAWFRTTSFGPTNNVFGPVVSLFNGGSTYCITTLAGDGTLRQYMDTGDFNIATGLTANVWYFVAMSRSITGGVDAYWAPQGGALTKVHNASKGTITGLPLRLLSDEYGNNPYMHGCAFKVWKEALTQTQLEAEMPYYSAQRSTNLFLSHSFKNGMDYRPDNYDPLNTNFWLYYEAGGFASGPQASFLLDAPVAPSGGTGLALAVATTITETDTYHVGSTSNNETGRSILITASVTPTDVIHRKEIGLSIPVAGAVTTTDIIHRKEIGLPLPIAAATTVTERAHYRQASYFRLPSLLSYDFADAGTTVTDRSGNGRNGTLSGGASQTSGEMVISAAGHRLAYTPDAPALPQFASVTVKVRTSGNLTSHNIWTKMRVSNSSNFNLYCDGVRLAAVVRGTTVVGPSIIGTGPTVAINTTYQVALTYDGTTTRMYLNGVEAATATTATGPLDMTGADTTWNMGSTPLDTSTPIGFPVYFDDPRFFDYALTAAEVAYAAITPVITGLADLSITATATVTVADTFTHVGNFNETGRSIPVTGSVTATDLIHRKEVGISLPIAGTITTADIVHRKELALSLPVAAATTLTDQADFKETALSAPVAATVTVADAFGHAGNFSDLNLTVPISGAVTVTDQADFHEPGLALPVAGAVTVTDRRGSKELALALPITGAVTTTDRQGHKELALSIPVTGAVATTDLIHRKELALSSPVVGTTALSVDQADLDELALSVTATATTTVSTAYKTRELNLSIPATGTTTLAVDRAAYRGTPISLPIVGFVTVVDLQQSPGHFDETQRSVLITGTTTLPVNQAKYREPSTAAVVTASVTTTDTRHVIEPTISLPIAATTSITTVVHLREVLSLSATATTTLSVDQADYEDHPLSLGITATVTCTDVRQGAVQNLSVAAVATVTATSQARCYQIGLPIDVAATTIGTDSLGVLALLALLITAKITATDFKSRAGITILGDADVLFLGDDMVSKVYAGAVQAWP